MTLGITSRFLRWLRLVSIAAFVFSAMAWGLTYWWGYSLSIVVHGQELYFSSAGGCVLIQFDNDWPENYWAVDQDIYPCRSGPINYGFVYDEPTWQFAGIVHYRDYTPDSQRTLPWYEFEIQIPHPWLLFFFALPPAIHWLIRRRRCRQGVCSKCGYDLRGRADASRCPECGDSIRARRTA
jgi:hypothetical protein